MSSSRISNPWTRVAGAVVVTFLITLAPAVARSALGTEWRFSSPGRRDLELALRESPYLSRARQARDVLHRGNTAAAIALLEELADEVASAAPTVRIPVLGTLGNAYLLGGQHDRAIATFDRVVDLATHPDDRARALANSSRASLQRAQGLERDAALAEREGYATEAAELRGRADRARSEALERAREARQLDVSRLLQARVDVESLRAGVDGVDPARVDERLASLPPSRERSRLYLLLAKFGSPEERARRFRVAAETDDARIRSSALGGLGELAADSGRWEEAADLAVEAQFAAQQNLAYESLYRWERLQGRALAAMGNRDGAIALYERSLGNLERIRANLIAAGVERQLDFDEAVEPYYRETMALLLAAGRNREAIAVSRRLQFAELQDYFGDDCAEIRDEMLGESAIAPGTAALYVLTLPEQTVVLLESAGGTLDRATVPASNDKIRDAIDRWRFDLEDVATTRHQASGQRLYEWFVAPFAERLATSRPEMLLVSADGALRDVPLAALYDAERDRYLVEDYAIATSFGRTDARRASAPGEALILALSEGREGFAPLPQVKAETQVALELLDGERLLDGAFRVEAFRERAASDEYRTLHIATHGEFRGTVDNSFLLASDGRLGLDEFEQTLRSRDEELALLLLTACQTAAGNGRATLGFAGIAARTGTATVFASLWSVVDETAATLVSDFYRGWLQDGETQVEALQTAQTARIRNGEHPAVWGQFVIVVR